MWWLWLVGALALFGSVIGVGVMSRRHRDRWGTRPGPAVRAGESPYREAHTRSEELRGVPATVRFAAGTGIAWGVLTLLIFTPAGFLLMAVATDSLGGHGWSVLAVILLLLVSCNAVALGFALVGLAPAVIRGNDEDRHAVRGLAAWSTVHHAAVLSVFALLSVVEGAWLLMVLLSLVPCALGLSQAHLLHRAADLQAPGASDGNGPTAGGV